MGCTLRDKYRVGEMISNGTRGYVFRASLLARPAEEVVLKVSDGEWEFRNERWLQEQGLQQLVGSPAVLDCFPLMRKPWTVCAMEMLGPNIYMTWDNYTRQEEKLRRAAKPMLQALRAVHAVHMAHTDVKPLNICESRDGLFWRLIDWGCAKSLEDHHREGRKASGRKGAPTYQSPEMLSDQGWDCPTDMWSLGVTLAELYVGHVWDADHPTLFSWPDHDSNVPDVLVQIEDVFGRLPNRMRRNMSERDRHSQHRGRFFSRFPPLLSDLLMHMFVYAPDQRITAEDALSHAWFAVDDHTPRALSAWLERTLTEFEDSWKITPAVSSSVNTVIGLIAQKGEIATSLKYLQRALDDEIEINAWTFNSVVEGCTRLKNDQWSEAGEKWLLEMVNRGMRPKEPVAFELICELVKKDLEAAEQLVGRLQDAKVHLSTRMFTQLAIPHGKLGNFAKAEGILEWLQQCDLLPDARFLSALMSSYANAPCPEHERAEFMARCVFSMEPQRGQFPVTVDGPARVALERALGQERWHALREEPDAARFLAQAAAAGSRPGKGKGRR